MRKIIFLSGILLMTLCMNTFSEESEKEKAWKNDDPKYVEYLQDIEKRNLNYRTPLIEASTYAKLNIVKALIAKKAKINVVDNIEYTPLHWACSLITRKPEEKEKTFQIAKLLIEHGAKVNAKGGRKATAPDNIFKIGGKLNITPLHLAVDAGNFEIVKLLVDHGADINAKDFYNSTPLINAVGKYYTKIVEYLILKGANVNVKYFSDEWPTPIFLAVGSDYIPMAELLIKYGADLHKKNNKNETPYDFAIRTGRKQMADFLKKAEEEQSKQKQK